MTVTALLITIAAYLGGLLLVAGGVLLWAKSLSNKDKPTQHSHSQINQLDR